MKEVFVEAILGEIFLCLCEDLHLMHKKDKMTIPALIEIEDRTRHHERLASTGRHIEEEMLARLTISRLEEINKILDRILLIWSECLGWMEIVRDEARDLKGFCPSLKSCIVSDTGKEKIPECLTDSLR